MRIPIRLVAIGVALPVFVVGCTGERDPRPIERGGTCRFEPTDARVGEVPAAIDGASADDLWVVGASYHGGASEPYARRWNGERWTEARVERVPAEIGGFHDVAAISGDEAWAVGSIRTREPIAQRWDGSAWSSAEIEAFPTDEAELFGVTAADGEVWAVGRSLDGRRWELLVMSSDGGSFRRVDVRSPAGVDAALRGIDAAAADDVWAVGWTTGRGGRLETLAMHHDGDAWRRVPTPNPGGRYDLLSDVAAVGDDEAWAVGWSIDGEGRDRPLILRWDGTAWRPVPAPELAGRAQLIGVSAPEPGSAWAAGRVMDATQTFASLILRWDGTRWGTVPTPDVGEEDDTLAGIAVVAGFPWAVGSSLGDDQRYRSLLLFGC